MEEKYVLIFSNGAINLWISMLVKYEVMLSIAPEIVLATSENHLLTSLINSNSDSLSMLSETNVPIVSARVVTSFTTLSITFPNGSKTLEIELPTDVINLPMAEVADSVTFARGLNTFHASLAPTVRTFTTISFTNLRIVKRPSNVLVIFSAVFLLTLSSFVKSRNRTMTLYRSLDLNPLKTLSQAFFTASKMAFKDSKMFLRPSIATSLPPSSPIPLTRSSIFSCNFIVFLFASSNALRVSLSMIPVTWRPLAFWNALMEFSVTLPIIPSTPLS